VAFSIVDLQWGVLTLHNSTLKCPTLCNTLQPTLTQRNTPQHTATRCTILQQTGLKWTLQFRMFRDCPTPRFLAKYTALLREEEGNSSQFWRSWGCPRVAARRARKYYACSIQTPPVGDMWMSHVPHEWVVSCMNESCHIWLSYVTYACSARRIHTTCGAHLNKCCTSHMRHLTCKWVISYINLSRPLWMSQVTYECVVSHMNESCHICMLCVHYKSTTFRWHVNESCPSWTSHVRYACVMSHMNESCHI